MEGLSRVQIWTLTLVCAFSALVAFKPSDPFLVAFLKCVKELSAHDVIHKVFPVWTYAYLGLLPALSIAAEVIGYRWVVLIGVLGRLATLIMLLLPSTSGSVELMQLQEVFIAAGFAAHPALMAIAYRVLPAEAYARAAGFTACAGVAAQVSSSLLGQLLLDYTSLNVLFFISVGATVTACLLSLGLPSPRPRKAATALLTAAWNRTDIWDSTSVQCRARGAGSDPGASLDASVVATAAFAAAPPGSLADGLSPGSNGGLAAGGGDADGGADGGDGAVARSSAATGRVVLSDIWRAYYGTDGRDGALRWYIWLSVASATHHLVFTYWQLLPAPPPHPPPPPLAPPPPPSWLPPSPPMADAGCDVGSSGSNGYILSAAELLGGVAALVPLALERCLPPQRCRVMRGGALVGAPPLLAVLLYVMATTRDRLFYGGAFVLFHLTFELMRVLCEAEGARCVARARYRGSARFALVGGINTFAALALQSALQALFQAAIPALEMQFKSLAALLVVLGAFFCLDALGFAASSIVSRCAGRDRLDDPSAASGGQETPPRYHEWDDRSTANR